MSADYIIKTQEQEIEEENYHNIIYETAHYIVNKKMSREDAFVYSKKLHEQRQDKDNYIIIDEDTMEIEYLRTELKEPTFEKTKQIEAVANELFHKFE